MANIHIYQQLNLQNKLSSEEEQRQNHGYGILMGARWERIVGEEVRREVRGLSTNR